MIAELVTAATLVTAPLDAGQGPGFTTPDPNGTATAIIRVPSVCGTVPLACNGRWDPNTGTFKFNGE